MKRTEKRQEMKLDELQAIVEKAGTATLDDEDRRKLRAAIDTLGTVTAELETKGVSIKRLRWLLFGAPTETTEKAFGKKIQGKRREKPNTEKPKGHGRNGAAAYTGADKIWVSHESLQPGDRCPDCGKSKVYNLPNPARLVRVTGMAPLSATVYEKQQLRCGLCGKTFTARSPEGVGEEKYAEAASSMVALLKYGCGFPFHRLERLQKDLGIPLPAATQWNLMRRAADLLMPVYTELINQAAQARVMHNDDTSAKILDLAREIQIEAATDPDSRTGLFTTGIVAADEGRQIALFFTGRKHAGENLEELLALRASELGPPIQMCDALSRNTSGQITTLLANCNSHARRKFFEVADQFPEDVKHMLTELAKVYRVESIAKKRRLSPEDRLKFHQRFSGPIMQRLKVWYMAQLDDKLVEPNSTLGAAIAYSLKHWDKLTLFLRVPGAPLDNNICERILKKAILHRKNALFFKTENGARVADLFMSLIHTSELHHIDPFDYLTQLLRHAELVAAQPSAWLPWNYRDTLQHLPPDSG